MTTPMPTPTPTIEEQLRDVSMVALYDSTMQGAQYLLRMLEDRQEAAASEVEYNYWRSRWHRVIAEEKAVPVDDPIAILVQRDIWIAEMDALGEADPRVATA